MLAGGSLDRLAIKASDVHTFASMQRGRQLIPS